MARKRMKSKIQPAVMTMTFGFESLDSGKERRFIDLGQCASIMNRRFYRQGLNWAVAGFKVLTTTSGQITIGKLPNTWVMSNAWEKGFRAWKKQQDQALEENESVKATYNDFKIFADADHLSAGFSSNLLPHSSATLSGPIQTASPGEWEPSQIVIPNFTAPGVNYEPFVQAVGDDVGGTGGTISLIKAYEDSRSVPQSPDPALTPGVNNPDNIYRAMFDVGSNMEDVLENASETNNDLPYPQLAYPGGDTQLNSLEIHDQEYITSTTIGGTTRLKGGNFPCGLISVDTFGFARDDVVILQLTLVPGDHRGYLCEPMTEM